MPDKTLRTLGASLVLAAVAVIAAMQIGPGGDPSALAIISDPPGSTVSEAVGSQSSPATSEDPPAEEPFTYRVGVLAGVSTDNFWAFYGSEASVWNAYVLGPTKPALFTVDPADGSVVPELAGSWVEPAENVDGWRVQVALSDGFQWSDGTAITADDIVFTFETARALGLGGSWEEAFPPMIESMHADTRTDLRIEFSERPNLAMWPHGPGLAPIMPAHIWEPLAAGLTAEELYALPGSADVGGGPLTLRSVGSEIVTSSANPGYPENRAPDTVEYHIFAQEAEAVAALAAGAIDSILSPNGLTREHVASVSSVPGVEVTESPANGIRYLGFNLSREPMSDQAFRLALALLIDREGLTRTIPTGGTAAYSFVNDSNAQWYDPDVASGLAADFTGDLGERLGSALASLRSSGYSWDSEPTMGADGTIIGGVGLTVHGLEPAPLTILTSGDAYDPSRPRYATAIAETLGLLGFDVRPVETDFDTVVDLAFTRGEDGEWHYDMYLLGWTLGSPSLPAYYRPLFAPDGAMNNTGYNNEAFLGQLAAYESSYTFDEARQALWAMESTLSLDLPYLLLYTSEITEAYRADRVRYGLDSVLGGLQGRLGGIGDVSPVR